MLYVPHDSSFISSQFFALNLDDWFAEFSKTLIFFDTQLLYYCINLRPSLIFCTYSGDIHLSLGISLWCPFVTISELFCGNVFDTL